MNEMELMMHLHLNNDRQGPGSEEMTRLALDIRELTRLRATEWQTWDAALVHRHSRWLKNYKVK